MPASFVSVVVIFIVFPMTFTTDPGQGFTYKYIGADVKFLEFRCENGDPLPDNHILMIAIYNTTTRLKMAQVVGGMCPTIEDPTRAEYLYLPGCSSSHERGLTTLKLLVTNYDSTTVQTFLCNVTKVDENNKASSVVWSVTVDKSEKQVTDEDKYAGHVWVPDSSLKVIASIEEKVGLLEPAVVVTGVILCIILFSMGVQTFLACKIIRILDKKGAPKGLNPGSSHSKISATNKPAPLEEEPFYATM